MTIKDNIISKNEDVTSVKETRFDRLYPENADATELTIASRPFDYSATAIARAVEDCDAHLLNLNVTSERTPEGNIIVDLRVNHLDGGNIARSLERYGFEVIDYNSPRSLSLDSARERANGILRILDI